MIYAANGEGMRDPHRDSDNMVIAPMVEDLVVQSVNRTIAAASGTDPRWGEPLHILRYRPGQQYRPHHDAHAFAPLEKRRVATALLYLNDAYDGGETHFPELDITVRGQVGDLLIFHNRCDGMPTRSGHAGLRAGEIGSYRWLRGGDSWQRLGAAAIRAVVISASLARCRQALSSYRAPSRDTIMNRAWQMAKTVLFR